MNTNPNYGHDPEPRHQPATRLTLTLTPSLPQGAHRRTDMERDRGDTHAVGRAVFGQRALDRALPRRAARCRLNLNLNVGQYSVNGHWIGRVSPSRCRQAGGGLYSASPAHEFLLSHS